MNKQSEPLAESGAVSLTDSQWSEARRRAAIIGPLAASDSVSEWAAEEAGRRLGLTGRTVYALLRTWRKSGGSVPLLAPATHSGGRGKQRLEPAKAAIVTEAIERFYLTAQKPRLSAVVKEIRRHCRLAGMKAPAANTVKARIADIRADRVVCKREGCEAARRLKPAAGVTPAALRPLDVIQMDHTEMDIVVVDPATRLEIGRPFLTIAIDQFSRCILGICVTLEPPSATSVGLCLTHAVMDKEPWLKRIGADCRWPMRGKPRKIYVDNGADFHSEALTKGCEVHGITLDYRPVGQPHYGGIVERVIGTAMQMIHELPGTTFSNVKDRGTYDAEGKAALTLHELEKWLTLAICGPYHNTVHGTLLEPPLAKWHSGVAAFGEPPAIGNTAAFLIDFLPVVYRTIQRRGFVIDGISYYASSLSPWIAERDRCGKFLIRYDPRDLSHIWVLDAKRNLYLEVPYRTLSNPPITRWERRAAMKRLREEGRSKVDEAAIFKAIEQMRTIADGAVRQSRAARRNHVRRAHLRPPAATAIPPFKAESSSGNPEAARPFGDIEEWC
jgi:putative transposase